MIIKIALLLLYLVIGLWLFVATVSYMGGLSNIPAYQHKSILMISALLVVIFWPIFIIQGLIKRGK